MQSTLEPDPPVGAPPASRPRCPGSRASRSLRPGARTAPLLRVKRMLAGVLLGPLPAAGAHRPAAQIEVGGHVGDEPASPAGDLGVAAPRAHGDSSTTGFHLPKLPVPGGASLARCATSACTVPCRDDDCRRHGSANSSYRQPRMLLDSRWSATPREQAQLTAMD